MTITPMEPHGGGGSPAIELRREETPLVDPHNVPAATDTQKILNPCIQCISVTSYFICQNTVLYVYMYASIKYCFNILFYICAVLFVLCVLYTSVAPSYDAVPTLH